MSAHEKALENSKKHKHSKGKDGKCEVCNLVMKGSEDLDEKGVRPTKESGAKNNDSESYK